MPKMTIGRRRILRGSLGGVAVGLALPVLDAMLDDHGAAFAQGGALPRRFGLFFWGNGVRLDRWIPSQTGQGWSLSDELMPLSDVKDYLSVVSGVDVKTGNERGHHAGTVGFLSAAPMISQDPMGAPYASTFSQRSVDQVVAEHWVNTTRFRSLELGISERVTRGEGTTLRYLSHNGPDSPNPAEYSPRALFDRIFVNGFTPPGSVMPPVDPRLALRRRVLDVVREDARALKLQLGVHDRQRIDQHLESLDTLNKQIQAIEDAPPPPPACMVPEAAMDVGEEQLATKSDVMAQILAVALACDQSRVFSIHFSGSVGGTAYAEIGQNTNHHSLTHDEPGDQPQVHEATIFIMAQLAKFLRVLKDTPEGDGNLLDGCAIMASTDTAEGQPHSIRDYPVLVAGRASGELVHPGIHYRSTTGENLTIVHLAVLQALGLPLTEFGSGGGRTDQPLGALRT